MLSQFILDSFARIPPSTDIKNMYFGVYDRILYEAFDPPTTFFAIGPDYPLTLTGLTVTFVVTTKNRPIFFLKIKPPAYVNSVPLRIAIDDQMRNIFYHLRDITALPRLHGISVIGERLAFYCLDKATGKIDPEYIERSRSYGIDIVPASRWDLEITTAEGYQSFMEVVNDVKEMVEGL